MKRFILCFIFFFVISAILINAQPSTFSGLVVFNVKNPTCGKANGSATAIINDTVVPDYYYWMQGDLNLTAEFLASDVYTFVISYKGIEYYENVYLSDIDGPKVNANVKDEKCVNSNDGSISLSNPSGIDILNYNWVVTGQTDSVLTNLQPGDYAVIISNPSNCRTIVNYTINPPVPLSITSVTTPETCGAKQDGAINITVNGGMKPYTLFMHHLDTVLPGWVQSTYSSSSFTNLNSGMFKVIVIDSNNCRYENNIILQSAGYMNINFTITYITRGHATVVPPSISNITGNGPFTVQWLDTAARILTPTVTSVFSIVKITDSLGCDVIDTAKEKNNGSGSGGGGHPPIAQICMITVDSVTGNNIIIWIENISTDGVLKYEIYRETLVPSVYTPIGLVNYIDLPIFVDTIANPFKRSWKYKVTAITDTSQSGNYSLVAEQKAIHLNLVQGFSGGPVNLVWDNYIGFAFPKFYIYRGHADSISCIDSVSSSSAPYYSYTDSLPPAGYLYYYVAVPLPAICNPANLKINEGPYSMSISNLEDNRMKADTSGNQNLKNISISSDIIIYPNPSTNILFIVSERIDNFDMDIQVYNYEGKEVIQKSFGNSTDGHFELNIERLPAGLYVFKFNTNNTIGCIKFVKQ